MASAEASPVACAGRAIELRDESALKSPERLLASDGLAEKAPIKTIVAGSFHLNELDRSRRPGGGVFFVATHLTDTRTLNDLQHINL